MIHGEQIILNVYMQGNIHPHLKDLCISGIGGASRGLNVSEVRRRFVLRTMGDRESELARGRST